MNFTNIDPDEKTIQNLTELWETIQKNKVDIVEITYKDGPLLKDRFVNFKYLKHDPKKLEDIFPMPVFLDVKTISKRLNNFSVVFEKTISLEEFSTNVFFFLLTFMATSTHLQYTLEEDVYSVIHERKYLHDSVEYIKLKSIPFKDFETVSGGVKVTITIKYQ